MSLIWIPQTFEDGFTASQNIEVSGTVNGVDISEEVLTLTQSQAITGKTIGLKIIFKDIGRYSQRVTNFSEWLTLEF